MFVCLVVVFFFTFNTRWVNDVVFTFFCFAYLSVIHDVHEGKKLPLKNLRDYYTTVAFARIVFSVSVSWVCLLCLVINTFKSNAFRLNFPVLRRVCVFLGVDLYQCRCKSAASFVVLVYVSSKKV